ncbi:hypothetical protein ACIP79_28280 [Streptomyces sp. NPDC088747]|uniref:hypothetical protein n=1 Tax=Streptomyces sp. NPDC088747 TaxID=3365886 RepID=UPI0037F89D52
MAKKPVVDAQIHCDAGPGAAVACRRKPSAARPIVISAPVPRAALIVRVLSEGPEHIPLGVERGSHHRGGGQAVFQRDPGGA